MQEGSCEVRSPREREVLQGLTFQGELGLGLGLGLLGRVRMERNKVLTGRKGELFDRRST